MQKLAGIAAEDIIEMESNLLKQVSAERILRPAGYYQSFALDFLLIASAAAFGFTYRMFLENGAAAPVAAASVAFLIFSAFEVVLAKSLGRRCLILVLEAAAALFFFRDLYPAHAALLAGAAAALVLLPIWGYLASRAAASNALALRFLKIIRPAGRKTVTALSLAMVLLYLAQLNEKSVFIPETYFKTTFAWAANAAKDFYPEIDFNATVDGFAESAAKYQLAGNPDFKRLAPAPQDQALAQVAAQVEGAIRGYLTISFSGKDSLSDVLYRYAANTVAGWQKKFGAWFALVWAIIAFLVIRSIGEVVRWLSVLLSYGIYQLLLATNVIRIKGEAVMKESLEFSG